MEESSLTNDQPNQWHPFGDQDTISEDGYSNKLQITMSNCHSILGTPGSLKRFSLVFEIRCYRRLLSAVKLGVDGRVVYVCCLLLFNVHGKHLRSCRDGQLT